MVALDSRESLPFKDKDTRGRGRNHSAPAQGSVALLYVSDNHTEEEIRKVIPFITEEKRRKTQPLH